MEESLTEKRKREPEPLRAEAQNALDAVITVI